MTHGPTSVQFWLCIVGIVLALAALSILIVRANAYQSREMYVRRLRAAREEADPKSIRIRKRPDGRKELSWRNQNAPTKVRMAIIDKDDHIIFGVQP